MFLVQKMDNSLMLAFGQLIDEGWIFISIDEKPFVEYQFFNSDFEKIKLSNELTSKKITIVLKYKNKIEKRLIYS